MPVQNSIYFNQNKYKIYFFCFSEFTRFGLNMIVLKIYLQRRLDGRVQFLSEPNEKDFSSAELWKKLQIPDISFPRLNPDPLHTIAKSQNLNHIKRYFFRSKDSHSFRIVVCFR